MNVLFINGRRNGYEPSQCGSTMTVAELIDWLEGYPDDLPVYLNNDNGFTFGNIDCNSFTESNYEEED